ncbi:MAG: zinc-dependent metalloprotease family protein [Halieaceae bacterium]|nr:zinc-dependent metalloprotease family protein [Halieaceae bacterium]
MVRNFILILLLWSHAGLGDTLFSYDESTRNRLMRPGIYDISWNQDLRAIRVNDTIDVATPQGPVASYRVETAKITNLGNWLISAKAANHPSRLQLVVSHHNSVIGSFEYANRRYQINSDKDSLRLTDIKATGRVYQEIDNGPAPWPDNIKNKIKPIKKNSARFTRAASRTTGTATIDVLFYYDDSFGDATTAIDSAVATGNSAFEDSGIDIILNIVKTLPLDLPETRLDLNSDLLSDMRSEEGVFSNIAEDRTTYKADIVHVMQGELGEDDSCGIANTGVPRSGILQRGLLVGLTYWDQENCSDYTFVHEIGHNLGSGHNRKNARSKKFPYKLKQNYAFPYSYGHRIDGSFRTIMSYRSDQYESRIGFFSAPDKSSCSGQACGIPIGEIGEADNATGFNAIRHLVAGSSGDTFYPESVVITKYLYGSCEDSAGNPGYNLTMRIDNTSSFNIKASKAFWLDENGSIYDSYTETDPDWEMLEPGEYNYPFPVACETSTSVLFGTEIRSGYWTYEDPATGELRETERLSWDPSYNVTVRSGPNGTVTNSGSTLVSQGESITLTASPDLNGGYGLAWFEGTCGGTQNGYKFTTDRISDDCIVTVQFEEESIFTVTPTAGTGGTITPAAAKKIENGYTTTFTVTANSGYEIDAVSGSCGGTLSASGSSRTYVTSSITKDCTVDASFSEKITSPGTKETAINQTIPGSTCKANDPGTSIKLQSKESGLTNTESDRDIAVTCPIALPFTNAINDISFVQFSVNLHAHTSNVIAIEKMTCSIDEYRGQELSSQKEVEIPLIVDEYTSGALIESSTVTRLSTFTVSCVLPPQTAIISLDTLTLY